MLTLGPNYIIVRSKFLGKRKNKNFPKDLQKLPKPEQGLNSMKIKFQTKGAILTVNQVTKLNDKETITEVFSVDTNEIPQELQSGEVTESLAAYGLKQLLQDRTSQYTAKEYGDNAIATKLDIMENVIVPMLKNGVWRETKRKTSPKVDMVLVQAIAEFKGVDMMAVQKKLEGMSQDDIAALKSNEAIAAKMKELKAKVEEVSVDLDDLF